jgi:SAM-dependent methyltransferase
MTSANLATSNPMFVSWEAAVQWLREQNDQRELVLACYYDDPLLGAAERYYSSEEWQAIRTNLDGLKRGAALDLGAGRGIASFALAKEGFEVTALEPDPSLLVGAGAIRQLAAETALPISICEQYSESIPFPNAHFDLIFGRAVLHHARDLGTACREVFRVLKPGGRFVAVREHVISKAADLPDFLAKHPLHKVYGGEHAFLLKEYLSALVTAGFREPLILSPLSSPINLSPQNEESLRREACSRLVRYAPAAKMLERILSHRPLFRSLLRLLTIVDHRPGRLYSFIADKR